MESITRKNIDWKKTGEKLQFLREHDSNFRRCVCGLLHREEWNCCISCEMCKEENIDNRITQEELAKLFSTNASTIANWERNRSVPSLEDLIFYSELSKRELFDIIVFD